MRKLICMLGAASMLSLSSLAFADVAVVVNAASDKAPSQADVSNIFLGKDKSLKAVDQESWSDTKTGFYSAVTSKNESQLKSYWSSLIFTGKGQPLPAVASDADVIGFVSSNADGIGYVDAASVTGDVKVLFTLP